MKDKKIAKYEDILKVVQQIAQIFKENGIDYIIGGSFAYKILTGDPDVQIHDVDMVVNEENFNKIVDILSKVPEDFIPIKTPFSIHVNHSTLLGNDNKPLDVSLDSFQHYYEFLGITMSDFREVDIEGVTLQIMEVNTLIKVYNYVIENKNPDKKQENLRKLTRLQNIR